MRHFLDFEKPIAELEGKIEELRRMSEPAASNIADEVARLTRQGAGSCGPPMPSSRPGRRPRSPATPTGRNALDYIRGLIDEFTPLAGDRAFADDAAVVGGLGRFRGRAVVVLGTEKGADTESRVQHNFGMARPEGYRKARRLMELAGRFGLPMLTFVDTAGAFPGIDAEARGQAEAIARSIEACLEAPVPFIATIIGEGGSGGAIALAAADRVLMLEHAIYSVISPGGLRQHPLARRRPGADRGRGAAAHRGGPAPAEPGGCGRAGADGRRAPRSRKRPSPRWASGRDGAGAAAGLDGATLRARRREKFLEMGRNSVV